MPATTGVFVFFFEVALAGVAVVKDRAPATDRAHHEVRFAFGTQDFDDLRGAVNEASRSRKKNIVGDVLRHEFSLVEIVGGDSSWWSAQADGLD